MPKSTFLAHAYQQTSIMAPLGLPGYRSTAAYCFDEEQADAIIRTTAYHRRDFGLAVIWYSPREHFVIRSSIATPFDQTANAGLGALDRLPLELLYNTFFHMDMQSLFKFRQINRMSRKVVDCLNQYELVATHGLNLFCTLLRTRLASRISLLDFYNALCTKACTLCGEFGGFISLPSWTRCCFKCLQEAPETQVQTLASARKQFHLTQVELNRLTSFKTLPGIYTMEESKYKRRIAIVSSHQAMLASKRQSHEPTQAQPSNPERNNKFNFMGSCALSYYDKQNDKIEDGISCVGCQLSLEKKLLGNSAENGTGPEKWAFDVRDKVYSRAGLLEHFRWCGQAQLLWTSSDEGKIMPPDLFSHRFAYNKLQFMTDS